MQPKLMMVGAVGTVVAAVCCFTPVLVIGLGALGLSAWLGWLDLVLLPILGLCVALFLYAAVSRKREPQP